MPRTATAELRSAPAVALAAVAVAAVTLRTAMVDHLTLDYSMFQRPWYEHIKSHGGFHALSDISFADYNVPYLYLFAGLTYLPLSPIAGIKAISTAFDLLQAWFVFRIVALYRPGRPWQPVAAGAVALFLPTVVANSGWWGQADAVFTSCLLGGIYFVLRKRPWWACTFFGLALAFKLQAVFVFPFLLVLVLVRRVPLRSLLAVPAVYLALDVPAVLLGADPVQLLTVYVRQAGAYPYLTLNAPTLYQFVPEVTGDTRDTIHDVGLLTAVVVVLLLVASAARGRTGGWRGGATTELTNTQIVLLATSSSIVVPFLLPSMHDRYFYIADLLTVVAAFHLPARLWYTPVLIQIASLGSYLRYLDQRHVLPHLPEAAHAVPVALALTALLWATRRELRHRPPTAAPPTSGPTSPSPTTHPVPGVPDQGPALI